MTNDTIFTHVPMCLHCGEKEVVGNFTFENGDGFCSAECDKTAHEEMFAAHSITVESVESSEYDDFLSQYDDDPSPYGGTYSEE